MKVRILPCATAWIALAGLSVVPTFAQRGDCGGAEPRGAQIQITNQDEPGTALRVTGTVYEADGETPVPGAIVFVYHTDAEGYYSRGGEDESNARLCGVMKTDSEGRYRYDTIRPGAYPGARVPQHVHYVVWGDNIPRQRADLHFADDPQVSRRYREDSPTWSTIRPIEVDAEGVHHVVRDIRLD